MQFTTEYLPTAIILGIEVILNFVLLLYVIRKFPVNHVTKAFSLFIVACIVWQFQDLFLRISADYITAKAWYDFFIYGIFFIGAIGLHFSLEYAQLLNKKNRFYILSIVYIPGILLNFSYNAKIYDFDLERVDIWNWGYKPSIDNLHLLLAVSYIGITAFLTFVVLGYNYLINKSNPNPVIRKQTMLVFLGYNIPSLAGIIGEIYFPYFTPYGEQRITTLSIIFITGSIFIALKKYRLFDYSPSYAIDEIINSIRDGVVITDKNFMVRYINHSFEKITKYNNDVILGQYISIIFKENSSLNEEYFYGDNNTENNHDLEIIIYGKDDAPIWVILNKKPIIDKTGNAVIGYLFTFHNVTNIRHAEELLELSDKKYKDVINTIEEGIIQINHMNEIIFFNQKTSKILGLPKEKIAFKNINSVFNKTIIPPEGYTDLHVSEITYITPKGNIKWLLLNIKPQQSYLQGYLISISDITDLKEKEFEILNSIYETQERERKRIAEELHDGLAQTLAAANMYLNSLNEKINSCSDLDDNTLANFNETKKILKQSLQETREISHDLMPIAISEYGLRKSLNDLTSKINKVNPNLNISFYSNFKNIRINPDIELALYRITQEIINNTIKHANATDLQINLYYRNGFTILITQDNGIGFNTRKRKKAKGLGISNFENRVIAFNGKMKIKSRLGEGTKIYIGLPTPVVSQ